VGLFEMASDLKEQVRDSGTLRKLLLPTAMGLGGSAVAMVLTRKPKQLRNAVPKVRDAMPQLPEGGIGELTGDLRERLDAVLGKEPGGDAGDDLEQAHADWEQAQPSNIDTNEFEERRAERRERREKRRRRMNR
jgi:hypothetical protein